MVPHSSTLAWKILWTEEPGGLQSVGSLGVGHNWATELNWTEYNVNDMWIVASTWQIQMLPFRTLLNFFSYFWSTVGSICECRTSKYGRPTVCVYIRMCVCISSFLYGPCLCISWCPCWFSSSIYSSYSQFYLPIAFSLIILQYWKNLRAFLSSY